MRKMLSIAIIAMLVFGSGTAIAGFNFNFGGRCGNGGWECAEEKGVTLNITGQDVDIDESSSATGRRGNFNDKASASVEGYVGFDMDLYANGTDKKFTGEYTPSTYAGDNTYYSHKSGKTWAKGYWIQDESGNISQRRGNHGWHPLDQEGWTYLGATEVKGDKIYEYKSNPAGVEGFGLAIGDAHAWSYAKDFGRTSKAGAGASFGGTAFVTGLAYGKDGCPETITGLLWIGGNLYQGNEAGETGYPNDQFVNGGNESWAGGSANKDISSFTFFGPTIVLDGLYVNDAIQTQGSTYVTIDPYGSNRSFYGTTQNSASVDFGRHLDLQNSWVGGAGGIAGMVQNSQGSYAAGQATFSYVGNTQGNGNATITGSVTPGGVFVTGSAHAEGN